MSQAIETIDVHVPVDIAYKTWTKFEDFPKFLSDVESVTQTADDLTEWKVKVGGVERSFQARITEQHPDERDFLLEVFSTNPHSVAAIEGLVDR